MDKFPLTHRGQPAGELTAERESLYTWFEARCRLPGEGLWCAWAVGERGELRLGVLEPSGGGRGGIRRRFSDRLTAPLGKLLWGEVRPAAQAAAGEWQDAPGPETLFQTPWLREQLRGVRGARTQVREGRRYLALPFDPKQPFPLPALFCFARVREIGGRPYAVFAFDQRELPVF